MGYHVGKRPCAPLYESRAREIHAVERKPSVDQHRPRWMGQLEESEIAQRQAKLVKAAKSPQTSRPEVLAEDNRRVWIFCDAENRPEHVIDEGVVGADGSCDLGNCLRCCRIPI